MGIYRHSFLGRCWGDSWGLHASVLTHRVLSSLLTCMPFVGSHILARTRCPPPLIITWLGKVGAEVGGDTTVPLWGPCSKFKSEAFVFVPSRLAYPLGSHRGPGTDTASLTALLPREPPLHTDRERRRRDSKTRYWDTGTGGYSPAAPSAQNGTKRADAIWRDRDRGQGHGGQGLRAESVRWVDRAIGLALEKGLAAVQ